MCLKEFQVSSKKLSVVISITSSSLLPLWTCGILRYTLGLCPLFLAQTANPWNFLSDRSVFCPSWRPPFELMLMRWLRVVALGSLRMGLVTHVIRVRTFSPTHWPLRRLSSIKTLENKIWWASGVMNRCTGWGGMVHPGSIGTKAPVLGMLLDLALRTSSSGCSSVSSKKSF